MFSSSSPFDESGDLERVQKEFSQAGKRYLSSPWSWLVWAIVLPSAALATRSLVGRVPPPAILILWSVAILVGGAVEGLLIFRRTSEQAGSGLTRWVFRAQGNISLVAVALSIILVWQGLAWILPGLWLLLLGHSFFLMGGLAFGPLRISGIVYQTGGLLALWPGGETLIVFSIATAAANLWMGWAVWQHRRGARDKALPQP